jgi:triacylglycerol lipase
MLARLQRFITLSLLTTAAAWAAVFFMRGEPMWAIVGALLILLGYAFFLALEFILLWFVNRADPTPNASPLQLLQAWFGEVTTAPMVFCWRQPFRSHAVPDFLAVRTGNASHQRGIVFIHGYVCNRGLWNPLMEKLQARGVPFVAVNLEPVFGSIDNYTPIIHAAVERITAATGLAPVLVAHSMGGLASRAWLKTVTADALPHRIITIGTPHSGTWLARFGSTLNALQMRQGDAWQKALVAAESPERLARFTCFYGHADNIVFPASTGTLPGAQNRHISACAHVHMTYHPQVWDEVLRSVRSQ